MTARWQEQIDVVTEFAGWSDEELFDAWIRQTRVLRGLEPDLVTGRTRVLPEVSASRGTWTALVRELAHAVSQAYLAIDTPAPADPEFCRIFLGAFGGVTSDSLGYRAEGEGAELPGPVPTFDLDAAPAERVAEQVRYDQSEARRRADAARRIWANVWSPAIYVGSQGPAEISISRTWIDWTGRLHTPSIDTIDEFLRQDGDIGVHRWGGDPTVAAPGARVAGPWTGGDLFVRHECALRMDFGDCARWRDHVVPAPLMEWRLWSEIADALERRRATDVMRDAWRWVTARNVAQLAASGLATSEVTDMIGAANIQAEQIQRENDIRTIARWTDVVASAAMAAGPYGAIVGAVLKAIATLLNAIPVAHGEQLDVWNRHTPAFSAHRLTGRPGREPTQPLSLPPGFGRALRGRLQILYPVTDANRLRVRVNNGVWRPHHWEEDLPVGSYQVDVEQPSRVPLKSTVTVRAGELTKVQLQPLTRLKTAQEREAEQREAKRAWREQIGAIPAIVVMPTDAVPRESTPAKTSKTVKTSKTTETTGTDTTETTGTDTTETTGTDTTATETETGSRWKWLKRGALAVAATGIAYAGWRFARRRDDVRDGMEPGAPRLGAVADQTR